MANLANSSNPIKTFNNPIKIRKEKYKANRIKDIECTKASYKCKDLLLWATPVEISY